MNKKDYDERILEHLSDTNTYQQINCDYSEAFRKKINDYLKLLKLNKVITDPQYDYLFSCAAKLPSFYALIKIHKPGYPIRPIVSFCGSPSYFCARFLSKILTPATSNCQFKLKNSLSAKEKLKTYIINDAYTLISFDIISLFTSIPHDLAISSTKKFLENNPDIFRSTTLNSDHILKLISLCLDASFFSSRGMFFKQIKGLPMGSPISVVLAEIVVQEIEQNILQSINYQFWFHFVDDIIACIPNDKVLDTLDTLNSVN